MAKIVRNVGIKVLDGTESWEIQTNNTYSLSKTSIQNSYLPQLTVNLSCTHFSIVGSSMLSDIGNIWVGNSYVNFNYDNSSEHLNDFKAYLADQYTKGTPVILLYPLATPTIESVAAQDIDINKGTYTAEVTEASLADLDISVKYLGNE